MNVSLRVPVLEMLGRVKKEPVRTKKGGDRRSKEQKT